jgi:hypothetical protein
VLDNENRGSIAIIKIDGIIKMHVQLLILYNEVIKSKSNQLKTTKAKIKM